MGQKAGTMKVVILAGGHGTRLSEETGIKPKPMVEIGGKPILWHIMKIYAAYGLNDFVICCGYKGEIIFEYFANYFMHASDVTFDLRGHTMEIHRSAMEPWRVTCLNTGLDTLTGGRIKRAIEFIGDETICMTYGDGVCDVNVQDLIAFHRSQGTLATVTAVIPPGRYGVFNLEEDQHQVHNFREKQGRDNTYINGGFFVLEPGVTEYLKDDSTVWELGPLEVLAEAGELSAFRHMGFWQSMDTLADKHVLQTLWDNGAPPWKIW